MTTQHKQLGVHDPVLVNSQTTEDLKSAGLIVSVLVNLIVFTTWLTLEVTDAYNGYVISFLQK